MNVELKGVIVMAIASKRERVAIVDDRMLEEYERFCTLSDFGHQMKDEHEAYGACFPEEDEQKLKAVDRHVRNLGRKMKKYLDILFEEEMMMYGIK